MSKKLQQIQEARAKWDDTVTEEQVIEKFGIDQTTLRKWRKEGRIKNFRYLAPSKTGNPNRPGRKAVYSIIELTQIFSATA